MGTRMMAAAILLALSACSNGNLAVPSSIDTMLFMLFGIQEGIEVPEAAGPPSVVKRLDDGSFQLLSKNDGQAVGSVSAKEPEKCVFEITLVRADAAASTLRFNANLMSSISYALSSGIYQPPAGFHDYSITVDGKEGILTTVVNSKPTALPNPVELVAAVSIDRLQKSAALFRAQFCEGLPY